MIEQLDRGSRRKFDERLKAGIDEQAAPLGIQDEREHIPRGERGDASLEPILVMKPLEHITIRVRFLLVAVDARIDDTAKNLAVTRIGEVESVRDSCRASLRAIAVQLSLLGD